MFNGSDAQRVIGIRKLVKEVSALSGAVVDYHLSYVQRLPLIDSEAICVVVCGIVATICLHAVVVHKREINDFVIW